jgi:arginine:ornithine antiporter/lysine permease
VTNGLIQLFLVITLFRESTYQALYFIASVAILPPYVLSGAYALKLAISGEAYEHDGGQRWKALLTGAVATLYGLWLVYAAGLSYLLMCALLYAPGIIVYLIARRGQGRAVFSTLELMLAVALVGFAVLAPWLMWTGAISPL